MKGFRGLLVVPLALGLLAAGCSGNGEGSAQGTGTSPPATASVSPSASPSPSVGASPSTSPSPSPSAAIEDGHHFGYIRSIDTGSQTLVFDLAYFLTGDEANEAAAEHGDETPVPNDYYVVNDNPKLRTLDVAPDVVIRVIDWAHCCRVVTGDIQPFVDAFATKHHEWDAMYQGSEAAYWLTVHDGVVTKIKEQYFP